MIFKIQTEVAKRICAKLNTKSYGYLSVLSQLFFDCKCHFDISGKIFLEKMGIINIQEALYNIGINPTSRAEQVSPKNYAELARVLHSKIQINNISNIY